MRVSEKTLLVSSIILALSGLCVLFIGMTLLEKNPLTYEEFLEEGEGVRVVLTGEVQRVQHFGNMTRIDFVSACTIPLIFFGKQDISGEIIVIGEKKFYKGKPELVVEKIITK